MREKQKYIYFEGAEKVRDLTNISEIWGAG
jgi:hypothetical protein